MTNIDDPVHSREIRDPLFASPHKMGIVLENLKDHSIFLLDSEGMICSWSPGSESVFGFLDSEIVGKPFSTIFTPEDVIAGIPAKELQIAHTRGKAEDERWHQRKDGSRFWASGALTHVTGEKGESQFIKVVRDATDRKRTEDADRMESIGRLAGGVAHDYNNLLTAMKGYCELLAASLPDDTIQQEWLGEVITAANRAANLTRDLLAFSRRQMVAPAPLDLNDTLGKLQGRLRLILGERAQLHLDLDPNLEKAFLDNEQFEQVVINLALNAREAMPEGGMVTITTLSSKAAAKTLESATDAGAATAASSGSALNAASASSGREIIAGPSGEIAAAEHKEYVTLIFKDNGKGMDSETAAHVFDPFYSTKAKSTGSVGLGMSTGYGIIQQSGGTISLTSVPGSGTEIIIHLPVHNGKAQSRPKTDTPPAAVPHVPAPGGWEGKGEGQKATILLVEDEAAVRKMAGLVLQKNGYKVLEAVNGEEGLATFTAQSHGIDLVLSDVMMPKMGGLEMAREILSRHPDFPILFMSGYSDDHMGGFEMPPGRFGFLQKPFSVADFLEKVDGAIHGMAPRERQALQ